MNKVFLLGNVVRDPELKYSSGATQTAIARYTLAVSRARKTQSNDQDTDFLPCITFGNQAEFANKYLKKGTKILVVGRIQTGSYTNKEGKKVYTTDVIVDEHYFVESKKNSNQGNIMAPQTTPPASMNNGWMNMPDSLDDDGLPFN